MSDTPRTDAACGPSSKLVDAEFARQLERELAVAMKTVHELNSFDAPLELQLERERCRKWRECAKEFFELSQFGREAGCSIQRPEEPLCDCGYNQRFDLAIDRFNELSKLENNR